MTCQHLAADFNRHKIISIIIIIGMTRFFDCIKNCWWWLLFALFARAATIAVLLVQWSKDNNSNHKTANYVRE